MKYPQKGGVNVKKEPLYMQIYHYLKEKIITGELEPNMQLPTELDLAEQFGVSRITSKRALMELENENLIYRRRGSGSFVKERIEQKYIKSKKDENKIISMILPFDGSTGLAGYIHGAVEYASAQGYSLTIHTTRERSSMERELLLQLPRNGIQGIIIYPLQDNKNVDVLYHLYLEKYPTITIDKYFDSVPLCSICSDNFQGGYLAADYFIQKGHTRIAFVSSIGIEHITSIRSRYFGYCKALKDHGISFDENMIFCQPIQGTMETYYEMLVQNLVNQKVTAVQTENDYVAVELLKACIRIGILVPEQISIIGFDNLEFTAYVEIPLTTIEQKFFEIGMKAAKSLITWIETGKNPATKEVLPVSLIERESVTSLIYPLL
ncbi:MAG: GntR family transcriptional regulator [Bacteroidales bacterium]|nr:GntR family transcriptional regulator [Bacteroidales bacterium]